MKLSATVGGENFHFSSIKDVLAKANEEKSGDRLAGIAAGTELERVAAKACLAELTLRELRENPVLPFGDEISDKVEASIDEATFSLIGSMTVGQFRDWLLSHTTTLSDIEKIRPALTGEIAAAVTKLMSNLDLALAAKKCAVVVKARTTLGLPGRLAARLQPNHPGDNVEGIKASIFEGLSYGVGDAVIGINPVFDSPDTVARLLDETADLIDKLALPTQNCVLSHITTQMKAVERGARAGLIFQSIAGSAAGNKAFGLDYDLVAEAFELAKSKGAPERFMYFETGQGSELSSNTHAGADQLTLEARCYSFCRLFEPFLVNDVVGFIGPEYLASGKQMIRAGLEDHFMGKLMGLPMGVDVCYTNHMDADQNDLETLAMLLTSAGVYYFMGVPMGDDVMLSYQSSSFHDIASLRELNSLRPAPEFEAWLIEREIMDENGRLTEKAGDAFYISDMLDSKATLST